MASSAGNTSSGLDPKLKRPSGVFSSIRWEHCAAGVCGGVISTLALHPLDLIKIRFQVNEGNVPSQSTSVSQRPQYRSIRDAFVTIARQEGLRGLYQGVTPNVWGAGVSWGLYFLFYNAAKTRLQEKKTDSQQALSAGQHMWAACQAGICTLVITNPVWVAKTRLCLQYDTITPKTSNAATIQYQGMADCLRKIFKYEGIRGLYKGFLPGVVGVSHGALQFMAYEELKKMYNNYHKRPHDTKFTTAEYLTFAALSKIFAAGATYPYQVVRSRLQDQHRQYAGILDVLKSTYRYEGARGFYKGLGPSLLRVTPACCITFVVYETFVQYLMGKKQPAKLS